MFCPNCGAEIRNSLSFCPKCGADIDGAPEPDALTDGSVIVSAEPVNDVPEHNSGSPSYDGKISIGYNYYIPPEPPKKRFYEKTWFIILMLIFIWPLGVFLMWKFSSWHIAAKVIISAIFAFALIGSFAGGGDDTTSDLQEETTTATEEEYVDFSEDRQVNIAITNYNERYPDHEITQENVNYNGISTTITLGDMTFEFSESDGSPFYEFSSFAKKSKNNKEGFLKESSRMIAAINDLSDEEAEQIVSSAVEEEYYNCSGFKDYDPATVSYSSSSNDATYQIHIYRGYL